MTSITDYSAMCQDSFLVFLKNYHFFPVSMNISFFLLNIKFYYCISLLVHGSNCKEGKLPYQETSRKVN